nr:diguanylate cyclase [uncultured Gemmiger sp.]
MDHILYVEINLICILIVAMEVIQLVRGIDQTPRVRLFTGLMIFALCSFCFDLVWGFLHAAGAPEPLSWTINQLYFLALNLTAVFWMLYAETCLESSWLHKRHLLLLSLSPAILLQLVTLSGLVFHIDPEGYQRGPLHWFQVLVAYLYIAWPAGKAFIKSTQRRHYAHRSEYRMLASFVVFPLIFSVLQLFWGGDAPMLCVGITLSIILLYQNRQARLISRDPLTGLNNRTQLIQYLSEHIKSHDKILYLMIMDANRFKTINDTYGHTAGDRALVQIATALKKAVPPRFLIARYGGDEFIVAGEVDSESEIARLRDRIVQTLAEENAASGEPFHVSLCIGYAAYSDDMNTIPDLIEAADRELYKAKKNLSQ